MIRLLFTHGIGTQMGSALAHATGCTLALTGVANGIETGRTLAGMGVTGSFTTGPTELTALFTICRLAEGAGVNSTRDTVDGQTGNTLFQTRIAGNVALTVERNIDSLFLTGVAVWTLNFA